MEQIAPKTAEIRGIWIGTELIRVQVSRMKIDDDRQVPAVRKKSKEKGKKGAALLGWLELAGPGGA
jgi:protein gp37